MNPDTPVALNGAQAGPLTSRVAWVAVGLAVAARFVGSRRFLEDVIVGVIGIAAAAELSQEGVARNLRRLIAWDNAKLAAYEKELSRRRPARIGSAKEPRIAPQENAALRSSKSRSSRAKIAIGLDRRAGANGHAERDNAPERPEAGRRAHPRQPRELQGVQQV